MFKKTKVVATLGPSCSEDSTIKKMVENGVDVFRINFSHADHKNVEKKIKIIRSISKKLKVNISILADLQGPKLRIGLVDDGSFLKVNDEFDLYNTNKFTGNSKKAFINYAKFASDVNVGEKVLLDDGKIILEIKSTNKKDFVKSKVIQGGELKSKRGVNLPNTKISLPALTDKDISDVIFAINNGVDWIALSFVRNQSDLIKLKEIIEEKSNHRIPIIAKIEKPEAIENIDEIIKNCDGIMVARGDLGVEVPAADVPLLQKKLVIKAKKQRIPVIIATQMMETMINKPTATRAEVNDVANSVMDGADAVMMLRIQRERMPGALEPDPAAYRRTYGLTVDRARALAPHTIVLHPAPMNRGVEIDSEVADGHRSRIFQQMANGVWVRMACLAAATSP